MLPHVPRKRLTLVLALTFLLVAATPAGSVLIELSDESTAPQVAAFEDTAGTTYHDAATALRVRGLVNGCEEDAFCPDEEVTRAQLATMLARALELDPLDTGAFLDLADNPHAGNVYALAEAGYVTGCDDGLYCPTDTVNRAQVATILAAVYEPPVTEETHFDDVGGVHGAAINRLAAYGIASGCVTSLTSYCPSDPALRGHVALFLARAKGLIDTAQLAPLDERREQQRAIDEEVRSRRAEERAETERIAVWEALADCESGKWVNGGQSFVAGSARWDMNTGNGYYGGLQFHPRTWRSVGGEGLPHEATKEEQIARAETLIARSTWRQQWPRCSELLGYR